MDDEWAFIKKLVSSLALFEKVTTLLSDNNYATLSLIYLTIFELKKLFNNQSLVEVVDFTNKVTILDEEKSDALENYNNDKVTNPITKSWIKISQLMLTNRKIKIIKDIIS